MTKVNYKEERVKKVKVINTKNNINLPLFLALYDGVSNMLGKKSGVAVQIKAIQPKAVDVETHCHRHSLILSVEDVTKSSRMLSDVTGTVGEITL